MREGHVDMSELESLDGRRLMMVLSVETRRVVVV